MLTQRSVGLLAYFPDRRHKYNRPIERPQPLFHRSFGRLTYFRFLREPTSAVAMTRFRRCVSLVTARRASLSHPSFHTWPASRGLRSTSSSTTIEPAAVPIR